LLQLAAPCSNLLHLTLLHLAPPYCNLPCCISQLPYYTSLHLILLHFTLLRLTLLHLACTSNYFSSRCFTSPSYRNSWIEISNSLNCSRLSRKRDNVFLIVTSLFRRNKSKLSKDSRTTLRMIELHDEIITGNGRKSFSETSGNIYHMCLSYAHWLHTRLNWPTWTRQRLAGIVHMVGKRRSS